MSYARNLETLTVGQLEFLAEHALKAAQWAHHGSTCRGWLSYQVNKNGERKAWEDIPKEDRSQWWQAFDETQCSCGLRNLRELLINHSVNKTFRKKEAKRIEGFGATTHSNANVASLKVEVEGLRNEVVEHDEARKKAEEERDKLARRLKQIQEAAG